MKPFILAYSPKSGFLQDVSATLERSNLYSVHTAITFDETLDALTAGSFEALILDANEDDLPISLLTEGLAERYPSLRVLVYPPMNNPQHPDLGEPRIDRFLSKPFNENELLRTLGELFPPPPLPGNKTDEPESVAPASTRENTVVDELPVVNPAIPADDHDKTSQVSPDMEAEVIQGESASAESIREDADSRSKDNLAEESLANILETEPVEEFDTKENVTNENDAPEEIPSGFLEPAPLEPTLSNDETRTLKSINYCCLLIPRQEGQYLVRGLVDAVSSTLPQILADCGWQMTGISVRPQYLQWNMSLPAELRPEEAVGEIRIFTSNLIYTRFPELRLDPNENDFWAPGYLAMAGFAAVPPTVIRDFINRARTILDLAD